MNAQQEAVALFQFLEQRGHRPSVRMVSRILRDELKCGARESSIRAWLAPFFQSRDASGTQSTKHADAPGTQKTSARDAPGTHPNESRDAPGMPLRARNKVSLVSKNPTPDGVGPATSPGNFVGSLVPCPKPVKQRKPWSIDYVPGVESAARALADVALADLTAEERFVVARYHALRFCQARAPEASNKAAALKLVGALSELGRQRPTGECTVRDYFTGLRALYELGGGQPIRSPYAFRGALQYGSVAVTA